MKTNKRLIANIIEVVAGAVLVALGYCGILDSFWSGMGTTLILVGGLFLIRQIRYRTNNTYKENVDVEISDERNKFLRIKAWSWAGYIFVMIGAIGTIVLKVVGLDEYMMLTSSVVCLMMILYWVSYMILKRKY